MRPPSSRVQSEAATPCELNASESESSYSVPTSSLADMLQPRWTSMTTVEDDVRRRRSKTRKLRARCVQVTKSGEMSHGDELRQQRQFCRSTPWTLCLRPPAGRDGLGIGASFGAAISRDGLAGEPSGAGPLSDAPARRDHSHRCRIRDLARAAFVT